MLGWIIYTKTDAKKNEWFISKFQKYATKNGTDLELIYVEDLTFGVLGGKCLFRIRRLSVNYRILLFVDAYTLC